MNPRNALRAILALLALFSAWLVPLAVPADAQADSSGWRGEYFNNMQLWGTPTWVRTDSNINFNWGAGSPDPRIPADEFSVRWTRTMTLAAGRYRFNLEADDGIRFFLDGALLLDAWRDQPPTSYSVERLLNAGEHSFKIEYYENRGGALARFWFERVGDVLITEWRGEYFNNRTLAGTPALVRNDTAVNFDWGRGSPDPAIAADNFSVRWSRTLNFEAGRYLFTVTADDGVRLYLDGTLIINEWRDQSVRSFSAERVLTAGAHTLVMEYYENSVFAVAKLAWQRLDATPIPPTPTPNPILHWRGEYFNNKTLSGTPALVRNDESILFDWNDGSPDGRIGRDGFSARWTRTLYFFAGRYRFFGRVDDGLRLYIDGALVLDNWRDQGLINFGVERQLTAGEHTIQVEYYENAGQAVMQLWWQAVSGDLTSEWRGEYFNNPDLSGAPVFVRNDREINFRWGNGSPDPRLPADNFSVRWMRRVEFQNGRYVFTVRSDDGVRLWIDGQIVINEWRDLWDTTFNVPVNMSPGLHTITLEYYEKQGNAEIALSWRGPIQLPSSGNLITCVYPGNSWIKAYQRQGDGSWLDINPRGWGPVSPNGYLKIDALPVDYLRWGPTGNPYRIELWLEGRLIRSVGNTAAGQPEFRIRPDTDNYTPWSCVGLW